MTKLNTPNPWLQLPLEPDFILPKDLEAICNHRNFSNLELETMPGQFAGGLDNAEIVLLALNPGFDKRDNSLKPDFIEANRTNHFDPFSSSFYYLDRGQEKTPGYEWWVRILKPLLNAGISEARLRKKLMLVEYFPYHSKNWKQLPVVPSQAFAFEIVQEAINRKKSIIIMRSKHLWYKSVPSLEDYSNKIIIKNPRQPYISIANLGVDNFNTLLKKLTA